MHRALIMYSKNLLDSSAKFMDFFEIILINNSYNIVVPLCAMQFPIHQMIVWEKLHTRDIYIYRCWAM